MIVILIGGANLLWGICLNQTTLYKWHAMCNLFDQKCTPYPQHNCIIRLIYLRCKGKDGNWYTITETYSSRCWIQAWNLKIPKEWKCLNQEEK